MIYKQQADDNVQPYLYPAGYDIQFTPPEDPRQRNTKHRILYIIIAVTVSVIIAIGTLLFFLSGNKCLTAADLEKLTGSSYEVEDFDSKNLFFSTEAYFNPQSTTLSQEYKGYDGNDQQTSLEALAAFYKAHSSYPTNIQLQASLNTDTNDDKTLANNRLASLRRILIDAGVTEADISSELLDNKNARGSTDEIDSEPSDAIAISIRSDATCRQ